MCERQDLGTQLACLSRLGFAPLIYCSAERSVLVNKRLRPKRPCKRLCLCEQNCTFMVPQLFVGSSLTWRVMSYSEPGFLHAPRGHRYVLIWGFSSHPLYALRDTSLLIRSIHVTGQCFTPAFVILAILLCSIWS